MIDMVDHFSDIFCEHPFEKNGFATLNDDFIFGGMENQTLTHLCANCWAEGLVAHEFAHQWFGDLITCGTWADVWLNESFATYSQALWKEHTTGYYAYRNELIGNANYYLQNNPGWAIYQPDWSVVTPPTPQLLNGAITYMKSSCVLHILRNELGDSTFFGFISSYASDPEFQYKSITTEEFNQKLNDYTGEDYDWFFNDWIYQPNHPLYENKYAVTDLGDGTWKLTYTVSQTQAQTYYRLPITIKIDFMDMTSEEESFSNNDTYEFIYSKQPINIIFDPYNEILLKEAYQINISAIEEQSLFEIDLKISPNPIEEEAKIEFDLPQSGVVNIALYDSFGRKVDQVFNDHKTSGKHSIIWNKKSVQNGLYFLKFNLDNNNVKTEKLIVN